MNQDINKTSVGEFEDINEVLDIVKSANMGIWRIELIDNEKPRMYVDDTMKKLLGIDGKNYTPEETYDTWFDNIMPQAVESVLYSVDQMKQGYSDENTYQWMHPTKGVRYVRCGGTAIEVEGGYCLRGYHYDVDSIIRSEQEQEEQLREATKEKNEFYNTLGTLESIFYSMHVVNLTNDTVVEYVSKNSVKKIVNHAEGATEMMRLAMGTITSGEYKEAALAFTDLTTIPERMKGKKMITRQFLGKEHGWFLASFITMEKDDEGRATKVIYTTRIIDEEKKQEEKLIRRAQTDELTGLLNRRSYEDDIQARNDIPVEENFIYISIDVNGLKIINDTKGHVAGDELIVGASQCMKRCLGPYGHIYRVGGDEFVAILFCSTDKLKEILLDFDITLAGWSGKLVDGLTVSYGWISKEEDPSLSVRQLSDIADKRMYEAKTQFYRRKGVDRKGQFDAHKALCESYKKVLKVNLSDDSYSIVNMIEEEKTKEMGFSSTISTWLKAFGESGMVHPEDLDNYYKYTDLSYMMDYFAQGNTSLFVFYRRKYGDVFKWTMMELMPAGDYEENNQSVFLYVKNIEK